MREIKENNRMIFKNKISSIKGKRGDSLVEFILIIPIMAIFLFTTWEIFNLSKIRISLINAARSMVWEKVDYTGGVGGEDPMPTAQILQNTKDNYHLPDGTNLSLTEKDSLSGGLDLAIQLSINNLGLNSQGLWESKASYTMPLQFAETLNHFFPGTDIPSSVKLEEKCMLLTDAWNSTKPGNSPTEGQVRDRIQGYWLLGPMDFTGGISGIISELLSFHVDIPDDAAETLGIPSSYSLCPEMPPRVNLKSVPDRQD